MNIPDTGRKQQDLLGAQFTLGSAKQGGSM
jgi:hypothetical protein